MFMYSDMKIINHLCIQLEVCVCVRARVCVWYGVRACLRACKQAYRHAYVRACEYMSAFVFGCMLVIIIIKNAVQPTHHQVDGESISSEDQQETFY